MLDDPWPQYLVVNESGGMLPHGLTGVARHDDPGSHCERPGTASFRRRFGLVDCRLWPEAVVVSSPAIRVVLSARLRLGMIQCPIDASSLAVLRVPCF